MEIPLVLPADHRRLMQWYKVNFPYVIEPVWVIRHGFWSGIKGVQENSYVDIDTMRQKIADEEYRRQEEEEYFLAGPGLGRAAYVHLDGAGNLVDNSAYLTDSPPPSRWASPEPSHDSWFAKLLKGRG